MLVKYWDPCIDWLVMNSEPCIEMKDCHYVTSPIVYWGKGCKVEFIQPSNWLYSVPNLLVIQHLVTLYLGGFDVRVVSEIE